MINDTGRKIFYLLRDIDYLIKDSMKHTFNKGGLTAPQVMVLANLSKNGPMKISELSRALGLSNSTISGIVDRLEKNNYVLRTRGQDDRRVVQVSIVKESEEKFQATFHEKLEKKFSDKFLQTDEKNLKQIVEGLESLKALLQK
ncbi:MarR family winged helix-turn-helix transcriptional regulator [Alkaliphilus crotonatoxidans]